MKTARILFKLIVLFLFITSAFAGDIYQDSPNGSFSTVGTDSIRAERVKRAFDAFNTGDGIAYPRQHIRPLSLDDYIDLMAITPENLRAARKAIQKGNVVIVDSCVGNAVRLGSPPGGKGAVRFADDVDITFLMAKYIRYAVEAHLAGGKLPHVLWYSPENELAVKELLDTMVDKVRRNSLLSEELRKIVIDYLQGKNIVLMGHGELGPVINAAGELTTRMYRNFGAGELVPALHQSGVAKMLGFNKETKVVFSNIDFDFKLLEVLGATYQAGSPDLLQVQIRSDASGGSAYRVRVGENQWKMVPLEGIEVPREIVENNPMLNSNTVVLQGRALDPTYYQELNIPFEKKVYGEDIFFLPKQSLCDIGKHPAVTVAVALGPAEDYFFTGSKNVERLTNEGRGEIMKRISAWESRAAISFEKVVTHAKVRTSKPWSWLDLIGIRSMFSCLSMVGWFF